MEKMYSCKDCGTFVSITANTCPKCGGDLRNWFQKVPKSVWGFILIVIAISVIKYDKSNIKTQYQTSNNEEVELIPANQDDLINIHNKVKYYSDKYSDAENDIQRSDAYRLMRNEIKEILIPHQGIFKNWHGQLRSIQTLGKGGEKLSISISSENNGTRIIFKSECSVFGNCGISLDNPVYNMVRNLREGNEVQFSGKFLTDRNDNLSESSFTEIGGISVPEFEIEFLEVLNIDNQANSSASQEKLNQKENNDKTQEIIDNYIMNIRMGVKLKRKILFSTDETEIVELEKQIEEYRQKNVNGLSSIKDAPSFEYLYIAGFNKSVETAHSIENSNRQGEIDTLVIDGMTYQVFCSDILLCIQNPELNYDYMRYKTLSNSFKIIGGVEAIFSDEKILKLPVNEYKKIISNSLTELDNTKVELEKFQSPGE